MSEWQRADTFAHVVERKDLGDHVFTYGYDAAGRLTHMAGNGETTAWYYLDTGLVSGMSVGIGEYLNAAHDVLYSTYSYDARGSKTGETMRRSVSVAGTDANGNPTATSSFTAYQDAVASYDALGRIVAWAEVGNPTLANSLTPPASIAWEYDAAGNIRRELVTYTPVDAAGQFAPPQTLDQWYRYDAMNRVVVAKGALTAYGIVAGSAGTVITYDAAGRRQTVSRPIAYAPAGPASKYPKYDPTAAMPAPEPEPDPGTDPVVYDENAPPPAAPAQAQRRETYAYTAAGRLDTVTIEDIAPDGSLIGSAGSADFDYDLQGRVVRQLERDASGAVVYDRQVGYDARGLVVTETVHQLQGGQSVTAVTTTDYGQGAGYALGAPVLVTTTATRGGVSTTSQTAFSYEYFDGPQQAVITYTPDTQQPTAYTTTLSYTGAGVLRSARIADGRPRTVAYLTDALGRAIRRGETVDAGGAAPVEIFYRFDDRELGRVGNNGSFDLDYAASIADRGANPGTGAFRNGAATGTPVAEFGSFEPVNSYGQGAGGGSYTVRTGDTLASIARAAFGDANLWYLIAAANGLNADAPLVEGQILAIPAGVTRTANTASTFRPYDPARIIGDVLPNDVAPSPTTPQPQAARRRNRCGIFGAILLTVVAVAVTALTSGAATTFAAGALGLGQGSLGAAVVGGALAGAAGSVASQVVGVATGIQEGFSFRGVALAALAGGIGGGVGKVLGNGAIGGSQFVGDAVRGLAGSALTQGVAVVTGLQSKFDFAGVAAAALGAGAGGVAGRALGRTGAGSLATRAAASTASGIANAAARSLIEGTSFGRNLLTALPDVIGQTVGGYVAERVAAGAARSAEARRRERLSALPIDDIVKELYAEYAERGGAEAVAAYRDNPEIRALIKAAARGYAIQGNRALSPEQLIALSTSSDRAQAVAGGSAGDLVVQGDRTFGDLVADTAIDLQERFENFSPSTKKAVSLGLSIVRGGPFGAAASYAFETAVSQIASATGADKVAASAVQRLGRAGFTVLSQSSLDSEIISADIAAANGGRNEGSLLVGAFGTILGITTLIDGVIGLKKLAGDKPVERGAPSLSNLRAQVGALKSLGVDKAGRRSFLNGEVVSFESRSASGGVYGFVQNVDGRVTSQLFSIADKSSTSAVRGFLKFKNDSIALARATGADTLELQGGSVINPRVARFLNDQGFATKSAPVPTSLGGGYQDVMYKVIKVK